ncbi:BtrH N-terminal domain-containing protein [Ruania halotolerans]|uniref:BtrH N-terminal domain-containing protein n=1 Tax=Ruania halotolerans TaxID=2897773 RepID=UPI001E4214E1|nr:BtrH N-terminal domain-containing protein [Ruania halotolerans]UFU05010.1 BtrH N-terminal domain-containing protein [Ruania halotolerans]
MTDETAPANRGMTIVDGVPTSGGLHCETTALGVLLAHSGLTLSEPMIFGLASGLSFVYWDSTSQRLPFLGGRVKPFVLTQNLATRLTLDLQVHETTSPRKAWDQVRASIDRGHPIGLQLDSHDLEYFTTRVHFAGHVAAMYGYDDERAYLVDTAQQGGRVSTSLDSLARARAAKGPMSARHRSFTLGVPESSRTTPEHLVSVIIPAITACAEAFLTPPIANLGNRGIRTAATRMRSWFDRVEDPGRDLPVIATLMERAGTGGALFRNLYRDFLTESHALLTASGQGPSVDLLTQARDRIAESALLWTTAAGLIEHAGTTGDPVHLWEASQVLEDIATIETTAMRTLRSWQ